MLKNTEFKGRMTPFVTFEYQGMEFKTKTDKTGGQHPFWNEEFEIQLLDLTDELKISCFDEDFLSNDLIGEKTFLVKSLC